MSAVRHEVATFGPYRVLHDPLVHLPWGLYRVYRGERYVGAQLSMPCASDCQHLDHQQKLAAEVKAAPPKPWGYSSTEGKRRGRPSNAERERRHAELERDLGLVIPTL